MERTSTSRICIEDDRKTSTTGEHNDDDGEYIEDEELSLIHISEPTRPY